jgi:hypothetical protein
MWGFKQKYKTEICRNWELTGHCEFRNFVSLSNINIFYFSNSAHLLMEIMNYKESNISHKTTRQDCVSNSMKVCTAHMG